MAVLAHANVFATSPALLWREPFDEVSRVSHAEILSDAGLEGGKKAAARPSGRAAWAELIFSLLLENEGVGRAEDLTEDKQVVSAEGS